MITDAEAYDAVEQLAEDYRKIYAVDPWCFVRGTGQQKPVNIEELRKIKASMSLRYWKRRYRKMHTRHGHNRQVFWERKWLYRRACEVAAGCEWPYDPATIRQLILWTRRRRHGMPRPGVAGMLPDDGTNSFGPYTGSLSSSPTKFYQTGGGRRVIRKPGIMGG